MPDSPISGFPAVVTVGVTDEFGLDVAGGAPTSKATFQQMIDSVKTNAGLTAQEVLFGGSSGEFSSDSTFQYTAATTSLRGASALADGSTGNYNAVMCSDGGTFTTSGDRNMILGSSLSTLLGDSNSCLILGSTGSNLSPANLGDTVNSAILAACTSVSYVPTDSSGVAFAAASTNSTMTGDKSARVTMFSCESATLNNTEATVVMGGDLSILDLDHLFMANFLSSGILTAGTASMAVIGADAGLYICDTAQTATQTTDTLFEVNSTTQASIPMPVMTEAERDAIGTPSEAQMVFNTTSSLPNFHNGSVWTTFGENNPSIPNTRIPFGNASSDLTSASELTYNSSLQNFRAGGAGITFTTTGFNNGIIGNNVGSFTGTGSQNFVSSSNSFTIAQGTSNATMFSTNSSTIDISSFNVGNAIIAATLSDITATTCFYSAILGCTNASFAGDPDNSVILAGSNITLTSTQQALAIGRNVVNNNFDNSFYANYLSGTLTAGTASVVAFGADRGLFVTDTAQTVTVATDTVFTVYSTTQASIPMPRMTQTQRDAITGTQGHTVFNTTSVKPNFFDGISWQEFGGSVPAIPNTQVAFGDPSTELTSDSSFTYISAKDTLFAAVVGETDGSTGSRNAAIASSSPSISGTESDGVLIATSNCTIASDRGAVIASDSSSVTDGTRNIVLSSLSSTISSTSNDSSILSGAFSSVTGTSNSTAIGRGVSLTGDRTTLINGLALGSTTSAEDELFGVAMSSIVFKDANGAVASTTDTLFEVQSTTQASIPMPLMTTGQRDAIGTPSKGQMAFNDTTNEPNYHDGTSWQSFIGGGGGESLAATLVIGNTTGGTDMIVSAGDTLDIQGDLQLGPLPGAPAERDLWYNTTTDRVEYRDASATRTLAYDLQTAFNANSVVITGTTPSSWAATNTITPAFIWSSSTATTGTVFQISDTSTSTGVRDITLIQKDAAATGATALRIESGSSGKALVVENASAAEVVLVNGAGEIGLGGTIDASAILDITSTTKGVKFPNMTQGARDAIGSPATGLVIFNTTTNLLNVYNGTSWVETSPSPTEGTHNTDWTGVWAVDQTANIDYQIIGSYASLEIPGVVAAATTASTATAVTVLPAILRPATASRVFFANVLDNGLTTTGWIEISAAGAITIGTGVAVDGFSGIATGSQFGGFTGWNNINVPPYKVS
ncbi:MAG: beta strand repeat-containing protein [Leucothrix sp.]